MLLVKYLQCLSSHIINITAIIGAFTFARHLAVDRCGVFTVTILQVTFVFTNQVDGKLVPIESKVSPQMEQTEGNKNQSNLKQNLDRKPNLLSQHHRLLQSISSNENSGNIALSSQPKQKGSVKSIRTSLKGTIKHKLSTVNQLPLKRLSPENVEHDDDFA